MNTIQPLLIISLSARALATAAKRAGFAVKCIDLFNDLDTQASCIESTTAELENGHFNADSLRLSASILDPEHECAVIYGSGFEANPKILFDLCLDRSLYGNTPDVIETVKKPASLAALLSRLDIPHPEIRFDYPDNIHGWLGKSAGTCGGAHVKPVDQLASDTADYYQRFVSGEILSATILSNQTDAMIIGYCQQWCADLPDAPFAHGGAITLDHDYLSQKLRDQLHNAVQALTKATGLCGLWNIDFIADYGQNQWYLIEINPRPGATFELFGNSHTLLRWHIDAVAGDLPAQCFPLTQHRAHKVVYAEHDMMVPEYEWPDCCTDRPVPGTRIEHNQPACMIHASASLSEQAQAKLSQYQQQTLAIFKQWQIK